MDTSFLSDTRLTDSDFRALIALVCLSWGHGGVSDRNPDIAKLCAMNVRSLQLCLARLRKLAIIKDVKDRSSPRGTRILILKPIKDMARLLGFEVDTVRLTINP